MGQVRVSALESGWGRVDDWVERVGDVHDGPSGISVGVHRMGNLVQDETRKARRHKNNQLDEAIRSSYRNEKKEMKPGITAEDEEGESSTIYEILDEEATHDFSDE